jgi:hypothetical protein
MQTKEFLCILYVTGCSSAKGIMHVWNYGTKTLLKSINLAELNSLPSFLGQVKFMD